MTREELNQGRHEYNTHRVYGYKHSYCKLTDSCEKCDKYIRLGRKVINKIEDMQTKRILKICK